MPGLLKEAPKPEVETPISNDQAKVDIQPPPATGVVSYEWQGVPLELAAVFNVAVTQSDAKTLDMLRDINKWSKEGLLEDTPGNRMQKIKDLEIRLGAPAYGESRVSKAWNWVRMDMHINELRKRQSAFER
jgi:hypothetical protein